MRKQCDGLYARVVSELNADPLSGDLFLFANRRRSRAASSQQKTERKTAMDFPAAKL